VAGAIEMAAIIEGMTNTATTVVTMVAIMMVATTTE